MDQDNRQEHKGAPSWIYCKQNVRTSLRTTSSSAVLTVISRRFPFPCCTKLSHSTCCSENCAPGGCQSNWHQDTKQSTWSQRWQLWSIFSNTSGNSCPVSVSVFRMTEAEMSVTQWFQSQAADLYNTGIQKFVPRYDKCLNYGGEYVEK